MSTRRDLLEKFVNFEITGTQVTNLGNSNKKLGLLYRSSRKTIEVYYVCTVEV